MNTLPRTLALLAALVSLLAASRAAAEPAPTIPGLQAKVEVWRDLDGIPHIMAKNEHDLFFMQGWIHAQDRLFQMDLTRRQASGTLAEVLGPSALASDVELRTVGLRRAAERSLPRLNPGTRAALSAYAAGVNAWVAAHALPPEYTLLELNTFAPWSAVDSIVIAKAIAFSLSFDLDIGLTQTFLTYVGAGAVMGFDGQALFAQDLFRSAPFDPASTVPDATLAPAGFSSLSQAPRGPAGPAGLTTATGGIRPETLALAQDYLDRVSELPLFAGAVDPENRPQGSNEWAVAGSRAVDGRPIIANDPHLSLNTPATFYQVHLKTKRNSWDVLGSSFAGVPGVVIGQNRHIAWGATTNPMDVTDTYQELIVPDPSSPSGLSTVYQGVPEPVIPLPIQFRANQVGDGVPDNLVTVPPGGAIPPVVLIVPRRNNGPILGLDVASGVALSVQYTGFSGTRELDTFFSWNQATGLADFIQGLQYFDFGSQNWVYTDTAGNIAYFTSGEMPLREDLQAGSVNGLPPWFIRDGTGGNEWLPVATPQPGQATPYALLPAAELPHIVNPPAGYFVNANNDPAGTTLDNDPLNQLRPGGGIYYLNPGYAPGMRAGRITQALQEQLAAGPVTREHMQVIQSDVMLLDAQVLTPYLLDAYGNAASVGAHPLLAVLAADPRIVEAAGRLAVWDFTTPTGLPEGYDASDRPGQLTPPTPAEIDASIAATIYSVWRGRLIANSVDATLAPLGLPRPGSSQAMTALRHLLDGFAVNQGVGASGLDFFDVPGVADAEARRDIILLRSLADALDLLAGPAFHEAFGGSTDQADYRWGRLHRLVLDHPLGGIFNLPATGGAIEPPLPDLAGFPVDGGFNVVDASSHSARASSSHAFMFGGGPVRRYVGGPVPGNRITGVTSLPGGESGVPGSPWYANLIEEWLTNETHPLRREMSELVHATVSKTVYWPARR